MSDPGRKQNHASGNSQRRGGLGRGLEALIPSLEATLTDRSISSILLSSITPNPRQPRTHIDEQELETLASSIRTHGVIQPIVVRPSLTPDTFTLIAGERRWRAAQRAGLDVIPAVVMDVSLQAQLELALVENVVRSDLTPLEEATAYRQLIDEFGLTQADLAERVGRSRVAITNTLRLLLLPDRVKLALEDGEITEGHARALLGLPSSADQIAMLETVIRRQLSVRETETAVRSWLERLRGENQIDQPPRRESGLLDAEHRLRRALSTNVRIAQTNEGAGSIRIDYSSAEQLTELLNKISGESPY